MTSKCVPGAERLYGLTAKRVAVVGSRNVAEGLVILIGRGRILNVSRRAEQPIAAGTHVIDASGRFVLPGLIDAHVHVGELPHNRFGVDDPEDLSDRFQRWFTSHGIVTVRDTGSPALDDSLRRLKAGRPEWPRIHSSGPNLDGPPGGPWRGLRVIDRPTDARAQVADLAESGADFVKVYVWMGPEVLRAVVEEAQGEDFVSPRTSVMS